MRDWKKAVFLTVFPILMANTWKKAHAVNDVDSQYSQYGKHPVVLSICTQDFMKIKHDYKINGTITQLPPFAHAIADHFQICNSDSIDKGAAITIKRRGFSSDRFAKKQYGFDFVDNLGEGIKASLVGLPAAEEWVLHGPYVDRSYIRNALGYRIGQKVGSLRRDPWFAPQTRFVELIVNDDYRGLYVLTEKIQRGKQHIDIPKTELEDPRHVSYILEISRMTSDFKTKYRTPLEYSYPGNNKIKRWERENPVAAAIIKEKITREVEFFEDKLASDHFAHPTRGYRPYMDGDSFVDYFLIREVFKDIDGFRRSAYFYKGRDNKMHMGPIWDFNIAAGNIRMFDGADTDDWIHGNIFLYPKPAFWFKRLIQDPYFVHLLQERYFELRQPGMPLDMQVIDEDIAILVSQLGNAPERDYKRWKGTRSLIESKILRTKKKGKNHSEHVYILRDWLFKRLAWLDRHIATINDD